MNEYKVVITFVIKTELSESELSEYGASDLLAMGERYSIASEIESVI